MQKLKIVLKVIVILLIFCIDGTDEVAGAGTKRDEIVFANSLMY